MLKQLVTLILFLISGLASAEMTEQWRWGVDAHEGDRVLSHSLTLYRINGKFEGHAGQRCSIAEGREKEIPLEEVEFDRVTRKFTFSIYWSNPMEDGQRRPYDAKFEGTLGDRNIDGVITYINPDPCLKQVEGGKIMMVYMDTGVKSDLVKEIIPPTANVKGRYDIRVMGRPSVNDLNGKKAWVGSRGHAFVGGSKHNFMDFKAPTQIEIEFVGKAFDTFKACAPIAREGAADPKNVIQIIGDGKLETKATKNPKNPVGLFTLKTLTRCREVAGDRKPFN